MKASNIENANEIKAFALQTNEYPIMMNGNLSFEFDSWLFSSFWLFAI